MSTGLRNKLDKTTAAKNYVVDMIDSALRARG